MQGSWHEHVTSGQKTESLRFADGSIKKEQYSELVMRPLLGSLHGRNGNFSGAICRKVLCASLTSKNNLAQESNIKQFQYIRLFGCADSLLG